MKKSVAIMAAGVVSVAAAMAVAAPAHAATVNGSASFTGPCYVGETCTANYSLLVYGGDSTFEDITIAMSGAGVLVSRKETIVTSPGSKASGSISGVPTEAGTVTMSAGPYASATTTAQYRIAPPSAPQNPRVTATTQDSVSLAWDAPASDGHAEVSYSVSGEGSISVSGTSATVSGLTAGTAYTFTVTASNSAGSSDGAAVTAETASAPKPKPGPQPGPGPQPAPVTPQQAPAPDAPKNTDGTADTDSNPSTAAQTVSAQFPAALKSGRTVSLGSLKTSAGQHATVTVLGKSPSVASVRITHKGSNVLIDATLKPGKKAGSVTITVDAPAAPGFEALDAARVIRVTR